MIDNVGIPAHGASVGPVVTTAAEPTAAEPTAAEPTAAEPTDAERAATIDVAGIDARFAVSPAEDVFAWAEETFGSNLVVLAAMTSDVVLVDLVSRRAPSAEVVFLDTGQHFPETLSFLDTVRDRYSDVRITVQGDEAGGDHCQDHERRQAEADTEQHPAPDMAAGCGGLR